MNSSDVEVSLYYHGKDFLRCVRTLCLPYLDDYHDKSSTLDLYQSCLNAIGGINSLRRLCIAGVPYHNLAGRE